MKTKILAESLQILGIQAEAIDNERMLINGFTLVFTADGLVTVDSIKLRFYYLKDLLRLLDNSHVLSLNEIQMKAIIRFYKNN